MYFGRPHLEHVKVYVELCPYFAAMQISVTIWWCLFPIKYPDMLGGLNEYWFVCILPRPA